MAKDRRAPGPLLIGYLRQIQRSRATRRGTGKEKAMNHRVFNEQPSIRLVAAIIVPVATCDACPGFLRNGHKVVPFFAAKFLGDYEGFGYAIPPH